jgi:hypothetical protein
MYSFVRTLRNAGHTRRYSIQATSSGWEVREEQDNKIVRRTHYQDWHRVERARRIFVIKFDGLCAEGWQETSEGRAPELEPSDDAFSGYSTKR